MRARQIVEAAENEARRMRHEIEDFCDQRLASFEILLERTRQDGRRSGRERLNIGVPEDEPDDAPEPDDRRPRLLRPGPRRVTALEPPSAPVPDGMNPLVVNVAELLRRPATPQGRTSSSCPRRG